LNGLLLDTHAFLLVFAEPLKLSTEARAAIEERHRRVFISSVSIYELAFKHRLGKLDQAEILLDDLDQQLESRSFERLDIAHAHALTAGRLDPLHRDPFDRLLIAQALVEDLELVSNEKLFDGFGVRRLW
jgi:PIN domain nuclease of toxin-antitoxin system